MLYYLIFLGLPYLLVNEAQTTLPIIENIFGKLSFGNWDQKPFGQYHQYTVRQNALKFNYSSFLANIKYLNWHFLPYLSVFVIIFATIYLLKNQTINLHPNLTRFLVDTYLSKSNISFVNSTFSSIEFFVK